MARLGSEKGHALIARAHTWDNHTCLPFPACESSFADLARLREIGYAMVSINGGFDLFENGICIELMTKLRAWLAERPDAFVFAKTVADVRRAKSEGKLAVAFDVEGVRLLDTSAARVDALHALGVRWMLLVYNRANAVGGGCHDAVDPGLSAFGKDIVKALNAAGIVPCCSHTGPRTALDIVDASAGPVVVSHSNPRALCDHPRNIGDDLIRAVAETGGVIGVNGVSAFLGARASTPERVAEHIDYVVHMVGPEHVGIGLDAHVGSFDLGGMIELDRHLYPPGFGYDATLQTLAPEALPAIVDAMQQRGYDDDAVTGILGDNWLRVAEACWR